MLKGTTFVIPSIETNKSFGRYWIINFYLFINNLFGKMSSQNLTIFYICKKISLHLSTAVRKDRVWPEGGAAYATGGVCGTAWELAREQLRCSTRRPSWSRTSPGSLAKARAQASPPGRGLGLQVARQRRPQSKGRTATQRNLRVRTVSEDKRAWSEMYQFLEKKKWFDYMYISIQ